MNFKTTPIHDPFSEQASQDRVLTLQIVRFSIHGKPLLDDIPADCLHCETLSISSTPCPQKKMNDYTQPEFLKSALLTIDTQCDTLEGGPLEVPGTNDILPNMASLLTAYRSAGLLIIHIVRIYQRDGSNVDLCRKQAIEDGLQVLIEGEPGCEIAPPLLPNADIRLDAAKLPAGELQSIGDNEVIMYKPRWGAFFNTPLESYLRSKEVNSVVFTGCNFPNCPRTSIYQAGERDFKIALASDALSGLYPRGITELENIGVQVSTTEELINRLATL